MTKRHNKKALISSLLVIALCFTMLVGTTFAWFTDSATSSGNVIKTGTLDVDLYENLADGSSVEITESTAPVFGADVDWEPNATYVKYFTVKNNGTLALKFKVALEVYGVTKNLNEVMQYAMTAGANPTTAAVTEWTTGTLVATGNNPLIADVTLAPNATYDFALAVHMDKEAGNEYQEAQIMFDMNVLATQITSEADSFGDQYDADATYPQVSASYVIPETATENAIINTENLAVNVPKELINALPNEVKSIKLAHTTATTDTANKTITFSAVDFVDQDGNVIDLEALGNTEEFEVTLPVGDAFTVGDIVKIYHDGIQIAEATVDANKNITYSAAHFCEITITEKISITVSFSDGYTKNFNSLAKAMRYGYSGGEQVAITVYEDITEEMDFLEGNIVCGKEGGVTIKNTIVDAWIYCDSTNFTIGEGVTYDATGYASGLFVYGDNCVINGNVITDCYYQRYADTKLTINAPGSFRVTTETFILRYTDEDGEAGIYINGDNDDSTVEFQLAVAYFYQGMISAKDATLKVGTYWQTNGTDGVGSANLVLDNSKLTVTVNEHNFKATGNSTVTLKNGSVLDVAGGIETTNEISVDATSTVKKAR